MINKCKYIEKIILTYKDYNGDFKEETVQIKKEGEYFRLNSIPFFAKNLSYGDLIEVEEDEGEFHFLALVEASGHSTIQMVFLKNNCGQITAVSNISVYCDPTPVLPATTQLKRKPTSQYW